MKKFSKNNKFSFIQRCCLGLALLLSVNMGSLYAQEVAEAPTPVVKKSKVVKNTFGSSMLIDNQTVMVPINFLGVNTRFMLNLLSKYMWKYPGQGLGTVFLCQYVLK